MLFVILVVIALFLFLCLLWSRRKLLALYRLIPCGLRWLPIIGHSYLLVGDSEQQMKALQMFARESTKRGGVVGAWHAFKLYIMITDPLAAECVLKTSLGKDDLLKVTHIVLGNGSLFASVPIWRPRRKILAPTFSTRNLNRFVEIFAENSNVMTKQMQAVVDKGNFSMWPFLNNYAMDSVCQSTMGVKVDAQMNPNNQIVSAIETLLQVGAHRMTHPWLHTDFVFKKLPYYATVIKCKNIFCGFVDEIIQSTRKSKQVEEPKTDTAKGEALRTLIDLIIESSKKESEQGYSDLELREESFVVLVAGTDTSAVGAAFTCVMLSRYPEVQEKVYQELQEVFGDSDRPVEAADLPRLKYLEAVIKETMRLYPPVPIILRKIESDVTLPSGVTLVDGCGVVINIWGIHHNPQYWGDDVEEFRPERFLQPLECSAAFMPFSHGPRNCLGYLYATMSMKTVVATVVRRFKILPAKGIKSTDLKKPLRVKYNLMMRDVDKYTIQIESRTKTQ
nr:CYP341B6 [Helicoverpa armigera]